MSSSPRQSGRRGAVEKPTAAGGPEIAARLRAARAKAGMTRKQLAAASGASERYLASLENGDANPSYSVLSALAHALDMAVAELLPMGGEQSILRADAAAALRRLPERRLAQLVEELRRTPDISAAKARRIVLVGLRGAGKSALGVELARRLDVPFLEISAEVERAYGGEIGLLIELSGQGALRRYEREAWDSIVAAHPSAVIAAPGGIVADAALYERILESAHSIWLQASPEDHMARVMAQGDFRPMSSNRGAMKDLKAILAARSADYARAEAAIDTSAQDLPGTATLLEATARRLLG